MIEAHNLDKTYGRTRAIAGVSFRAAEGEILGFLGPNGAGKTTTLRILTGFMPPSGGTARVAGFDVTRESFEVRRRIGYLPERAPLYLEMTTRDFLNYLHEIKGYSRNSRKRDVDAALERCGLTKVATRILGNLSRGYRQRAGLAQAVLGDPKVLVLDEPTVGLDPAQVKEIRELIRGFAAGRTIIFSTHILSEVSMLCSKVVIINRGRIVLDSDLRELNAKSGQAARLQLAARAPRAELEQLLWDLPGMQEVRCDAEREGAVTFQLRSRTDFDLRAELARRVVAKNWELLELRSVAPSLEELYLEALKEIEN